MNRQTTCSKKNTHLIHIFLEVQGKICRGYTRDQPEKCHRAGTGEDFLRIYPWPAGKTPPRGYRRGFPANIPVAGRKNAAARVQGKISRGYTRDRPEKRRRAGPGEDFPRIYPWPAGKTPPRGYRRGFPANIPVASRENAAARVQGKICRGYTRDLPEKCHRAGTGKDFPRLYPRPAGKTPPRGYRERKRAYIPGHGRRTGSTRPTNTSPRHKPTAAVCTRRCLIRQRRILASVARAAKRECAVRGLMRGSQCPKNNILHVQLLLCL